MQQYYIFMPTARAAQLGLIDPETTSRRRSADGQQIILINSDFAQYHPTRPCGAGSLQPGLTVARAAQDETGPQNPQNIPAETEYVEELLEKVTLAGGVAMTHAQALLETLKPLWNNE